MTLTHLTATTVVLDPAPPCSLLPALALDPVLTLSRIPLALPLLSRTCLPYYIRAFLPVRLPVGHHSLPELRIQVLSEISTLK